MSDIIHLLPDSVANQIAAGEVIQRPASVLKELVENSIDAGATHIQVVIKDAGRTLIQVVDNGKGMSETDARMAFERHATSKISSADDLFSLRTMGFRGEALASIAAVAQVELRTRRSEDELGVLVEIAGTRVFKQEMTQCEQGTTLLVKNLFFNVPARRRFLKSDNVEKSHLLNEFYRIALVNPGISFNFYDGDEEIFQLPAANTKVRIDHVFGKNSKKHWQQQLLSIETSTSLVNISGFVGKPEYAQKSATQYFFVNGRYMRHPYFHKAVLMAYNQMISANESPNYFIYFEVDPQTIDINIHPTKTEIKFENEQAIWSILTAAIKESLGKFNIVPSIDFDQEGAPEIPAGTIPENIRPPQTNFNPNYNPFSSSAYKRPSLDWENLYKGFENSGETIPEPASWQPEISIPSSAIEGETEVQTTIGNIESQAENFQYKSRYIITSIKSGLLVIDQHRAHTRVLFDQFLGQIENAKGLSQQVIFPETLELTPDDAIIFEQMLPDLNNLGFRFEVAENYCYTIKGVSAHAGTGSVVDLILDMLDKAKTTAEHISSTLHETIALAMAEASSLKAGQRLTSEEMSDLTGRLFSCPNHSFTPDGKKIMTVFTQDELEKRF
ncbi:MAG TPA: DNA mismatch repair endonuclease MutL [Paludibacter sp.]|nr:DNA mismatch repair endonuclease MutL [Paludibacter sp.]